MFISHQLTIINHEFTNMNHESTHKPTIITSCNIWLLCGALSQELCDNIVRPYDDEIKEMLLGQEFKMAIVKDQKTPVDWWLGW